MKKLDKKEIMKLELDMLCVFEQVCKKHDLYYTLCGGTLLGAIRHKGYIPWDDDIDIMMTRPDFERLCDLIKQDKVELPSHLKFISWFTKPSMDIPFLKIIDTRTHVEEKYMTNDKHLWIDILVIDGCPEDKEELKKMFIKSLRLRKILFTKQTKPGTGKTKLKALSKDFVRLLLKPISAKWICHKLEELSKTYDFDKCKYIGCIQWGYGPQERVHKDPWLKPIEVEFEGYKFNGPTNYDEYLSHLYGDYMKLPPLDKRVSHDMLVMMD